MADDTDFETPSKKIKLDDDAEGSKIHGLAELNRKDTETTELSDETKGETSSVKIAANGDPSAGDCTVPEGKANPDNDTGKSNVTTAAASGEPAPGTSTTSDLPPGTSTTSDLPQAGEASSPVPVVVDEDSDSSSVSAISNLSGLSGEASWRAASAGPMAWVYRCMEDGMDPRIILRQVIPDENMIPAVDDLTLWKMVINIVSEPPPRTKLTTVNTLENVIHLLKTCKNIMVLTGAGVSVSCGIPDFRSRNGIYARLAVDFPDLPDPQAMFDIRYFRRDQRPFFKFAKEIYPGKFEPSRCHKFIQLMEKNGQLLRNYTQNIDTLEQVAGITKVIQCHGSFAKATCMACSHSMSCDDIKADIMKQVIPMCPKCDPQTPMSVMKPDIVFFGESLPEEFHNQMTLDKDECDLLVVIGSSLKVRPVALVPDSLPPNVPQILINKEPLRNLNFDVELLGDCDTIVAEICHRLGDGWDILASKTEALTQVPLDQLITPPTSPKPGETEKKTTQPSDTSTNRVSTRTEIPSSSQKSPSPTPGSSNIESSKPDTKDLNSHSSNTTELKPTDSNKSNEEKTEKHEQIESANKDSVISQSDKASVTTDSIKETQAASSSENETKIKTNTKDTTAESGQEVENKNNNNEANTGESAATADTSRDQEDMKRAWRPNISRISVASKLAPKQFCFIPPNRYVFSEAEVYTIEDSDSEDDLDPGFDSDDMNSDSDMDTTSESHNRDTSGTGTGGYIDLTSDDEKTNKNTSKNGDDIVPKLQDDISHPKDTEVKLKDDCTESNVDVKEAGHVDNDEEACKKSEDTADNQGSIEEATPKTKKSETDKKEAPTKAFDVSCDG